MHANKQLVKIPKNKVLPILYTRFMHDSLYFILQLIIDYLWKKVTIYVSVSLQGCQDRIFIIQI